MELCGQTWIVADIDRTVYDGPTLHKPSGLWMFGNRKLLNHPGLAYVSRALAHPTASPDDMDELRNEAEYLIHSNSPLVTGFHNAPQAAVSSMALKWGMPQINVYQGGLNYLLKNDFRKPGAMKGIYREPNDERAKYRTELDPISDLYISARHPDYAPTGALHDPAINALIDRIAHHRIHGIMTNNPEIERANWRNQKLGYAQSKSLTSQAAYGNQRRRGE